MIAVFTGKNRSDLPRSRRVPLRFRAVGTDMTSSLVTRDHRSGQLLASYWPQPTLERKKTCMSKNDMYSNIETVIAKHLDLPDFT